MSLMPAMVIGYGFWCQSTLSRYLSTISRPQDAHRGLPCREATAGTEEDEEREEGEYESSSKTSSGPEEPCQKPQSDNVTTAYKEPFLTLKITIS